MSNVPDLRVAICKRCRWPSRRASGASTDEALKSCGRALVDAGELDAHVRLSQCLNCCDGGHTVRLEHKGWEFAFVGIRTEEELREFLRWAHVIVCFPEGIADKASHPALTSERVPSSLLKRVYQIWHDGALVWHLAT